MNTEEITATDIVTPDRLIDAIDAVGFAFGDSLRIVLDELGINRSKQIRIARLIESEQLKSMDSSIDGFTRAAILSGFLKNISK